MPRSKDHTDQTKPELDQNTRRFKNWQKTHEKSQLLMSKLDELDEAQREESIKQRHAFAESLEKTQKEKRAVKEQEKAQEKMEVYANKAQRYWHRVYENGKNLSKSSSESYNDWAASMMSIIATLPDFYKALRNSFKSLKLTTTPLTKGLFEAAITATITKPKEALMKLVATHVLKAPEKARDWTAPSIESLKVELNISMELDERGYLHHSVTTDDNEPLTEEQQEHFDVGILAWANMLNLNYKLPSGDEKRVQFLDGNNPMSNDQFTTLCTDSENGIHKFFEGKTQKQQEKSYPTP